jgi:polysaccharide biosynthesis transport protein
MKPTVEPKGYSPMALLRALKRRKLFFLIPVLVLAPAITLFTLHMPKRYKARALVGSAPAISGLPSFARPDALVTLNAQDQLRAIKDTLLTTAVLERVIREFHLYDIPPDRAPEAIIEAMRKRIEIQLEGPEAFYVGFEGSSPGEVMKVANRLAGLFLERKADMRGKRVEQEDTFLDAEVARLETQVREQEGSLKVYKQSAAQGMPERLTANLKQMETIQGQIQAKTDQITEGEARKSALTEEINALASQGVLESEPPAKTTAETTLDQLRLRLNELKTKYTPEHPEILRTEKEIRDLEAARPSAPAAKRQPTAAQVRYVGLQAELKSIDPRLENYRRERDALIAEMRTYEGRVNAAPVLETGLTEQTREAALIRARYETLLAKQQEAKLSHRAESNDHDFSYRIIEPAQAPQYPYSPHRVRIIAAGFIGSLGVGLLFAFFAERANPSFETTEELERYANLPVLSSVPAIPGVERRFIKKKPSQNGILLPWRGEQLTAEQRRHFQQQRLSALVDPQSVAAQQYSILALKIQHWMAQTGGKMLLVTSASGGEGKSLTALNLSLALASSSEGKVLLVDSDLRMPQVHERLGLNTEHGFSDLLAPNGGEINQYISRVGALDLIPGGSNPADPVTLLASARAKQILKTLRNNYHIVVIDSPPIVPIADSHILAGLCDGVVLVVRARQTRPELLYRAVESLGASNIVGVVLNDVELTATPYEYAYRYYRKHYLGRS